MAEDVAAGGAVGEQLTERLFLAVALSDDVRHGLAAFLDNEAGRLPGKPVPPANWHLTLRFLGTTEQHQRDLVVAFLDDHATTEPFVLGFDGLGGFARPARATVLWLGVGRGSDPAAALAMVCEEAAQAAGFDPEDRPFHPHVTLSRIRPKKDVSSLVDSVPRFPLTQTVDRITLYRSILGRDGARYEVADEVEL
ncbi:MAG: RNA 2',3'-cyclic phosphodiesterase [Actinobacteria bacterium]|nr:RNA 2',3'-cyclic phosphodiesterase [Actinomycetota bacterium]